MSDEDAPTWRYAVPGLLFLGFAVYLLVSGELPVDKRRTVMLTRAGDPLIYWSTVLVTGTVGVLALRKLWQRIRGS